MTTIAEALRSGLAHREAGRLRQAESAFRSVLRTDPKQPDALHLLGLLALEVDKASIAVRYMRLAAELRPEMPEIRSNLGEALRALGKLEEAAVQHREAIRLRPEYAEAHSNLGNVLKAQGRREDAERHYREAIRLRPAYLEARYNLGTLLKEESRIAEAVAMFGEALKLAPDDGLRIKQATLLPAVLGSVEEVDEVRRGFESRVDALLARSLKVEDPLRQVGQTNFYLAYHGRVNRDLHRKVATLHERACPALLETAPHCREPKPRRGDGRIRLGFVSQFFSSHSVGKFIRGLIANLPRERLHVTAVFGPPLADDPVAHFIRERADAIIVLPGSLAAARRRITEAAFDVLCYADIGMEPLTYFLAFARLAPVQCVALGHADTSGIRNLDYFISADNHEPAGADAHYSERLVRLKAPIAYSYRPAVPGNMKSRRELGLSESEHLYVCPQSLFKLHPAFDALLAQVLRADPRGRVLLKSDKANLRWTALVEERLRRTAADVFERITILPAPKGFDFINLIAVSDAMLDPTEFSGHTTSIEALTVGTPIVTLPGERQCARATLGFYRDMEMPDCVAENAEGYASLAARLGSEPDFRKAMSGKILERNAALFENPKTLAEYERFFLSVT